MTALELAQELVKAAEGNRYFECRISRLDLARALVESEAKLAAADAALVATRDNFLHADGCEVESEADVGDGCCCGRADENAAFIANALDELESLRKSRIAELNVELDRAGSKHDAAVRRADDAEALLREARHALRISRADTPNGEDDRKQAIARIDAHLKENT